MQETYEWLTPMPGGVDTTIESWLYDNTEQSHTAPDGQVVLVHTLVWKLTYMAPMYASEASPVRHEQTSDRRHHGDILTEAKQTASGCTPSYQHDRDAPRFEPVNVTVSPPLVPVALGEMDSSAGGK